MLNGRDGLAAVFAPRRVALVGASDRPGSVGRLLWDNLAGFPGEVVPVGPAEHVGGQVAYPAWGDVPGEVDLAVLATPAATVPGIIRAAAAKGIPAVVVLSAGFAETGAEGAALQAEAVAAARAGGVRLVGPNCFGVQNADLPLNASIAAGTPRGGGGVSIVTQSGSYGMAVHALGQDEGLRVAKVFAAGNKADITDAELLAYLRQDPDTSVICLLLESITDARGFFTEACLTTTRKPVVAVVGGRTSAGQRAALSHTAALATDDAVRDAALRQAGVVRVRTGLQVLDAARALSSQPVPRGPRVAVITNSGGTGVELTDLLADEGLVVPELSESLQKELRAIMPGVRQRPEPGGHDARPGSCSPRCTRARSTLLARSGEVDVVVPVLLQRSASAEVARRSGTRWSGCGPIRCRCRSTCAGSRRGPRTSTPGCCTRPGCHASRGRSGPRRWRGWRCDAVPGWSGRSRPRDGAPGTEDQGAGVRGGRGRSAWPGTSGRTGSCRPGPRGTCWWRAESR